MRGARCHHDLPRGQAHPDSMPGTRDCPHESTDTLLPQAAPVCDEAAACATAVDRLDPPSAGGARLRGHVLPPGQRLAAWCLGRYTVRALGECEGQEVQMLQLLTPSREGGRPCHAHVWCCSAVSVCS
jgi:hypothetical protein